MYQIQEVCMTFHGASDVDDALNAMDYSVYGNDVRHIFLDNLQFMLARNERGVGINLMYETRHLIS